MTQGDFESLCADLAESIRHHNLQVMMDIIRQCPRVLAEQPFGQHPMHWAAAANNCVAIEYLLSCGISPDVRANDSCDTPLSRAAGRGHVDAGRVLIRAGATLSPTLRDGRPASSALYDASFCGQLPYVKLLVEAGCDVNLAWNNTERGDPPRNALTWALLYDQTEVAEYLRSVGAKTVEELGLVLPTLKKGKKR